MKSDRSHQKLFPPSWRLSGRSTRSRLQGSSRHLSPGLRSNEIPANPMPPWIIVFFSAIKLLGEIGPAVKDAIPTLRINLQGIADAAWALWRIDSGLLEEMTQVFTTVMETSIRQPNRLDQLAQGSRWERNEFVSGETFFAYSVSSRMAALGAL